MAVNREFNDPFFDALVKFQRHITGCYDCKAGIATSQDSRMCIYGVIAGAEMAKRMAELMALKRAAIQSDADIMFACPDLSKHGMGYATVARPMRVVGYQDGLF